MLVLIDGTKGLARVSKTYLGQKLCSNGGSGTSGKIEEEFEAESPSAAANLREGIEETLTLHKLGRVVPLRSVKNHQCD